MAPDPERRQWMAALASAMLTPIAMPKERDVDGPEAFTLYTFGDSILDCGHYNPHGLHPGSLLLRNDDRLFPDFKGRDLLSAGPARLEHRARDGATVADLAGQVRAVLPGGPSAALLTIGGNDLLRGLAADRGPGIRRFADSLNAFLKALPIRPVLVGTVYDPTFNDDSRNFLGTDARLARANHRRVNETMAELASRYGHLVDLHAHFLTGDPGWYTRTIEPSLRGASEVRRAFWPRLVSAATALPKPGTAGARPGQ
ncbi:SGNH/GDSL hydrolase family protein [Aquabacterium sp. A7-Y]|uniref:SGNH/GDSL hydrolase family protein n=1 Tax=Aquabacterium sp. A7-Y TaxID=1349605 RepID=UPI00223D3FDB|nr:SGNH/GDSL hydrolase family protein [Aquabacterium sp. A7-Y]MCW7539488.1 SGNH/GDSL hydrolase family protein [Aquabacterium sp. A7-Y]